MIEYLEHFFADRKRCKEIVWNIHLNKNRNKNKSNSDQNKRRLIKLLLYMLYIQQKKNRYCSLLKAPTKRKRVMASIQ